jgi:hypothetical protein
MRAGFFVTAATVIVVALVQPVRTGGDAPAVTSPLSRALLSAAPDPNQRNALDLFGRFVGNWKVEVSNHLPDGRIQSVQGEWHFGWILDGTAIQDVWMAPARAQLEAGEPLLGYGTTLRLYDAKIDAWRVLWASASYRNFIVFTARQRGNEIVMEADDAQPAVRWIFSDVGPRSFKWRALQSKDGWNTSAVQQEMTATRIDDRDRLADVLLAPACARGFESENALFGQLTGDWTIGWEGFRPDGTIVETDGSLHVGWILDGRVVQDVWRFRNPSSGSFVAGTTIRLYDPHISGWHSIWFYPSASLIQPFVARPSKGDIVLEGTTPTGDPEQWIFSKMTPTSFDWRATESADRRNTWHVTEHMRIHRASNTTDSR